MNKVKSQDTQEHANATNRINLIGKLLAVYMIFCMLASLVYILMFALKG